MEKGIATFWGYIGKEYDWKSKLRKIKNAGFDRIMTTADKVKELIASQLNKSVEDVTEDKEIVKDLGADSLDVVEMLMGLEEEYGITVPEEDAINIKTVGDIINLIEGK
jgi:acyl carrier protein